MAGPRYYIECNWHVDHDRFFAEMLGLPNDGGGEHGAPIYLDEHRAEQQGDRENQCADRGESTRDHRYAETQIENEVIEMRRPCDAIELLIIHCADWPNGRPLSVPEIDQWHRENSNIAARAESERKLFNQDLTHFGYHAMIDLDGTIHTGRALDEAGCHCAGHNYNSIGVVLVGRDKFTVKQWAALRELVLRYQEQFGVEVHGHREFNKGKLCPGFSVQAWLASDMQIPKKHLLQQGEIKE